MGRRRRARTPDPYFYLVTAENSGGGSDNRRRMERRAGMTDSDSAQSSLGRVPPERIPLGRVSCSQVAWSWRRCSSRPSTRPPPARSRPICATRCCPQGPMTDSRRDSDGGVSEQRLLLDEVRGLDRERRRARVIATLRELAIAASRRSVRFSPPRRDEAGPVRPECSWGVNGLALEATPDVIERLAGLPRFNGSCTTGRRATPSHRLLPAATRRLPGIWGRPAATPPGPTRRP